VDRWCSKKETPGRETSINDLFSVSHGVLAENLLCRDDYNSNLDVWQYPEFARQDG
jgi:hypothetical protein